MTTVDGPVPVPAPRANPVRALLGSAVLRFVAMRFLGAVGVCAALLVVTFLMVRLLPGDPARAVAGARATPGELAAVRHQLGLDLPVTTQFLHYVGNVLRLDFGRSFLTGTPVTSVLLVRLPRTALLAAISLVATLLVGVPLGLAFGGRHRDGRHRGSAAVFTALTGLLVSLPSFLVATLLAYVFAVRWQLLPVAGDTGWQSLVLPAASITLFPAALLTRIVRRETLAVLTQDYIRTARGKRLSSARIYLRHVLPNATAAALSAGMVIFAQTVGGAVIVENVFSYPGMGTALVTGVLQHDYPVVQAITLLLGVVIVVVNTIADLLLAAIDPRTLVRPS
jgi:peptide/nickel transport system permease protein